MTIKNQQNTGDRQLVSVREFKMTSHEGNNYTFEADVEFDEAGQFRTAVRMFPKNKNLPHRQDFCYVKWVD